MAEIRRPTMINELVVGTRTLRTGGVTRSIRTSPPEPRRAQPTQEHEKNVRLVAKVLRELLRTDAFTDVSDLHEALKCRCARLKIRGYASLTSDALRLVGSNVDLVQRAKEAALVPREGVAPPAAREVSRAEAAAIVEWLRERCPGVGVKAMAGR